MKLSQQFYISNADVNDGIEWKRIFFDGLKQFLNRFKQNGKN